MVKSKSTCPKWHFDQVGHGGKKPYGEFFWPKFPIKKVGISYSDVTLKMLQMLLHFMKENKMTCMLPTLCKEGHGTLFSSSKAWTCGL
jgi:hypothetical protein